MAEKPTNEKKNKTSSPSKKTGGKSTTKANVNRIVKAGKKYDADKSIKDNADAVAGVVEATATSAKRASNKKQKKLFTALLIVLIIAIIGVCVFGYFNGWFDSLFKKDPQTPQDPVNPDGDTDKQPADPDNKPTDPDVKPDPTPDEPESVSSAAYDAAAIKNENLSIHFLELGNKYTGDCVYIKAGETDILIDAGSKNNSAPTITAYLNRYVTDGKLEYVIATHAHEDHLAGFYSTSTTKGIFENFKTDVIIDFALSAKTFGGAVPSDASLLGRYLKARDAEIADGATHYTAAQCFNETDGAKRVYELADGITLEILYNYYYFEYDLNSKGNINSGENNYSVCCIIHNGDDHYLFTGDLESEGEEKLVEYYKNGNDKNLPELPHCKLYKAGHHGSKTSSTNALLNAVTPEFVCVCCCAGTSEYTSDNSNQFPTQDFVTRVAKHTDAVYVTTMVDNYVDTKWGSDGTVKSMNGDIVFCRTANKITLYFSENDKKLKDTDWFKEHRICPEEWQEK